jgi:hypothetical protein
MGHQQLRHSHCSPHNRRMSHEHEHLNMNTGINFFLTTKNTRRRAATVLYPLVCEGHNSSLRPAPQYHAYYLLTTTHG